jgi:hypothetical protein
MTLSVTMLSIYAECRVLLIVMLSLIILIGIMLSVVALALGHACNQGILKGEVSLYH